MVSSDRITLRGETQWPDGERCVGGPFIQIESGVQASGEATRYGIAGRVAQHDMTDKQHHDQQTDPDVGNRPRYGRHIAKQVTGPTLQYRIKRDNTDGQRNEERHIATHARTALLGQNSRKGGSHEQPGADKG